VPLEFDRFTFLILRTPAGAPDVSDAEAAAIQDGHLAHLKAMHDAGQLLAAGPCPLGDDDPIRGFGIFAVSPDEAAVLMADDPAVKAGRFETEFRTWLCPKGAVHFTPTRFPASIADARR
jgi:uncharacterized protein YciI